MKDFGQADVLLDMKVNHEPDEIILPQSHYLNSLLKIYRMKSCQNCTTLLVTNIQLTKATIVNLIASNTLVSTSVVLWGLLATSSLKPSQHCFCC
jgi:hypothetical protein